jgi:lysophospholipase L1-like esterase
VAVRRSWSRFRGWKYLGLAALLVAAAALITVALRPVQNATVPRQVPAVGLNPVQTTALFLGDSSVAGAGASKPAARWTTLVAGKIGWKEINLAKTGSGYAPTNAAGGCDGARPCTRYSASVADIVKAQPRVVVVGGGRGEDSTDATRTAASISQLYRALRTGLPEATIIAVGPWSNAATPGKPTLLLDSSVQSAAKSVRATYVSLLSPRLLNETMTINGGTRLNDEGHRVIADRVVTELDAAN